MTKRPGKPRAKSKVAPKSHKSTKSTTRPRRGKVAPREAKPHDSVDLFVDAAVLALDLPLEPAWRPAVKMNLQVILQQSALFADFDLPDETEPAPVFRA
jgi:hypothetical protein